MIRERRTFSGEHPHGMETTSSPIKKDGFIHWREAGNSLADPPLGWLDLRQ